MKKLMKLPHTPRFVPDYMAQSVVDIDFARLRQEGVEYIAFDADSTLVPSRGKELDAQLVDFLRAHRELFRGWCIASNRITNDLQPLADAIDAGVVQASLTIRKPQKRFFDKVRGHFDEPDPRSIAMFGDKLIADMYGGKKSGLTTVWVEKMGQDHLVDRLIGVRRWEARLMSGYVVEEPHDSTLTD